MKFTPKTREQLNERFTLKEGQYKLTVVKAEEKDSKKGFPMIVLTLKGVNKDNREVLIPDWLLEQNLEKLLAFCEAANLTDKYNSGELNAYECLNANVWCYVTLEDGGDNPKGGKYPKQNRIKSYLLESDVTIAAKEDKFTDDNLPF